MSEWINVRQEGLPEFGGFYLFRCTKPFAFKSHRTGKEIKHPDVFLWYFDEDNVMDGVTHWMPLPEPPKD